MWFALNIFAYKHSHFIFIYVGMEMHVIVYLHSLSECKRIRVGYQGFAECKTYFLCFEVYNLFIIVPGPI